MAMAFSLASHTGGGVEQYLAITIDELGDWYRIATKLLKNRK